MNKETKTTALPPAKDQEPIDIPEDQKQKTDKPLFVSFYYGDEYYYQSAKRLREDCEKFGLDNAIVEAKMPKGVPWIQACRYKVRLVAQFVRECDRPVVWVDVDTRILKRPDKLLDTHADLAVFLRGFQYLREFDPVANSRMIGPQILYYGGTPVAKDFVALMAKREAEYEGDATDDFFLQEAWENFDKQMSVLVLPPELVYTHKENKTTGNEYFYVGLSGQVSTNRTKAVQHDVELYTPARRKAVLLKEANDLSADKKYSQMLVMLQRAFDYDPTDERLAYRLANLYRRLGRLNDAITLLKRYQGENSEIDHARRYKTDTAIMAGMLGRAEHTANELAEEGSASDKAWAESRLMRIKMQQRARKLNLSDKDRVVLWWMEKPYPGNFGDMLNPYLIEKLTGKPPIFSEPKNGALLAIGSTIKFAVAGSPVWGAGTPRMSDHLEPKANYLAVRGPLTRQLVIESDGTCPEVYGDPAWFLPKLYQPKTTKKYKLGLIKHFTNNDELKVGEGVKEISVIRSGYEGIEEFVDDLNECEAILSTSLHGFIVAHAYGIPARWCEVSDASNQIPGDGTKYHEYMMTVGLEPEGPLALKAGTTITLDMLKEANRLPKKQIDLEALAKAAPFEITADWQHGQPAVETPNWLRRPFWLSRAYVARGVKNVDELYLGGLLRRVYAVFKP